MARVELDKLEMYDNLGTENILECWFLCDIFFIFQRT